MLLQSRRPVRHLHFIWIIDRSISMQKEGKMAALNEAIREAVPHMQEAAGSEDDVQVLVRAAKFSDGAEWHIREPLPAGEFAWDDIETFGLTDLGRACRLVAGELERIPHDMRGFPPLLALVTDGRPTDDFPGGLKTITEHHWGKCALRTAVGIGEDTSKRILQEFIGDSGLRPMMAFDNDTLKDHVRWCCSSLLKYAINWY